MAKISVASVFVLSGLLLFAGTSFAAASAAQTPVDLGTAGNFILLAKSGISTTGITAITGDIGVSPISSTAITGFGLSMDSSNQFATSSLVNGKVLAANYTTPTPSVMTTAVSDMQTAYSDAAGRTNPTATELGAGTIGGMTLAPGLYKWSSNVLIPTDVTLSGGANDVWIFQIAGTLNISSATQVLLIGGAQAKNIFWQVAGQTTLGTTSVFHGIILDQTAIVLETGARLDGRALAQTAVTLDSNNVSNVVSETAPVVIPVVVPPAPVVTPNSSGNGGNGTSVIYVPSNRNPAFVPAAYGAWTANMPNLTSAQKNIFCRVQKRAPTFTSTMLSRLARRLALRWNLATDQVQKGFTDKTLCY